MPVKFATVTARKPVGLRHITKLAKCFRSACCRTVLLIKDGLFEVVPGIYQVRGYDISV